MEIRRLRDDETELLKYFVWARIMNDYGHVDDDTPSLAISLYKEYRGKGIGTELMRRDAGTAEGTRR